LRPAFDERAAPGDAPRVATEENRDGKTGKIGGGTEDRRQARRRGKEDSVPQDRSEEGRRPQDAGKKGAREEGASSQGCRNALRR